MCDRPPPRASSSKRRGRWSFHALSLLVMLGLIGAWVGCSPDTKYRVLSTFFDGVPNPNAPAQVVVSSNQGERNRPGTNRPTSSVHKPYADQKCDICHVGGAEQALSFQSSASLKDSNLCMKCHDKIPESHRLMHAPVAAKACLFCHSPHESPLPHLLSASQPQLCTQCHEQSMLGTNVPEHEDPKSQCLDCHSGHGSETSRYFLRALLPATRPATSRPAVGQAAVTDIPAERQAAMRPVRTTQPAPDRMMPTTRPVATTRPSLPIALESANRAQTFDEAQFRREHPLFLADAPTAPTSGEPLVIGARRATEPLHLDPIQVAVEGRYYYEHDTSVPPVGTLESFSENRFEEDVFLKTTGYIVHPNLVDLRLAGTFGLRQDILDVSGQHEYGRETIDDYDVSATILRKEQMPITLYSRRTDDITSRRFGASFDDVITSSGGIIDWKNPKMPVRIEAYHSDEDQTALDQSQSYSLSQNVANAHTDFAPTDHQRVNINYTFSDVTQTNRSSGAIGGPQVNAFDTNDLNINHLIEFGSTNKSNLSSSLSYFDQTGDFPYERLRESEWLLLRSSDTFETRYRYTLDYQSSNFASTGPLEQTQHTFETGFTHRLYSSLITTGTAGVRELDRSDQSGAFEYFAGLNFDYHKLVPLGALTLDAGYNFDQQKNRLQSAVTHVINQSRTFVDPTPIILIGTNIIAASIVIRSANSLIIFTPGVDYLVRDFPDRVEIERVVGGRIADGQTVLISYDLSPLPANTATNNTYNFAARYDIQRGPFKGLGVYGRYTRLDQSISSASPTFFIPNSFHDTVVGTDYRIWEFTFGAEQDWHHSTIAPYDASRFYGRFQHRLGMDTTLLLNPTYTIYRYLEEHNRADEVNMAASVTHRISNTLTGSASISYMNLHDRLFGTTEGIDANVELRWSFRQTTAFVQLRQALLNTPSQDNTYQTVWVGFRREF